MFGITALKERTMSEKGYWHSKKKKKRLVLNLRLFCILENDTCPLIGLLTLVY